MTRNAQNIIDDMRNIVKPRIGKMLLEANFEGCGKEDKTEFETEFEMILTLAEKALVKEPIFDKIRDEIENHCGLTKENHCRYCSYCNILMGVRELLEIIDKYKAESEETDADSN